ncbi:MAG: energy transducer TonB family protein [Pseudomonadota bacterium]
MTEPAYQQTPYPLVLALSVALFLHVALATLVNSWLSLPEPDRSEPTVRVRIAMAGAQPSTSQAQTVPETTRAASATQPEPQTDTEEESSLPADASTEGDTDRSPEQASADPDPQPEARAQKDTTTQSEQTVDRAQIIQVPGTDSPVTGSDADTPVTRLSQDEVRQRSDYEIALWEKIAQQVAYTPSMAEMRKPREVVLDLRLMANGALRRARIETSSGLETLDGIAREAALAATPFPEPPEGRRRFSVRLIFEPDAR